MNFKISIWQISLFFSKESIETTYNDHNFFDDAFRSNWWILN